MELLQRKLECRLQSEGSLDLDRSFAFLENEDEVTKGEYTAQPVPSCTKETDDTSSGSNIERLTKAITDLTKSVNTLNATIKRKRRQEEHRADMEHRADQPTEKEPVIYEVDGEETNLTSVTGGRPSKFGINLAKRLFTEVELQEGMLSPQKSAKSRKQLSPKRTKVLKDAVNAKFGSGHWEESRAAINQYGLDAKRRKKQ